MHYYLTDVTAILFLVFMLSLGVSFDFWLRWKFGEAGTWSAEAARWSMKYPLIPMLISLLIGILFGHLWWPNFAYCPQ